MDGVVLCHLANHIHPRSVAGIHVPSPAVVGLTLFVLAMKASLILQLFFHIVSVRPSFQPKLGMAKCRRNVENFLEACRKIGVPEVRPLVVFQFSHSLSSFWELAVFFFFLLSRLIFTTVNV